MRQKTFANHHLMQLIVFKKKRKNKNKKNQRTTLLSESQMCIHRIHSFRLVETRPDPLAFNAPRRASTRYSRRTRGQIPRPWLPRPLRRMTSSSLYRTVAINFPAGRRLICAVPGFAAQALSVCPRSADRGHEQALAPPPVSCV